MKGYSIFNLLCLCLLSLTLGANFWLWKNTFFVQNTVTQNLPPEVSFDQFKKTPPFPATSTSSSLPGVMSSSSDSSVSVKPSSSTPSLVQAEIPQKINLAVPFTSQAPEKNWDEPWQDACEEAAVLMLDAYYKDYKLSTLFSKDEILKMVNWEENVNGWGRSIEIEKIQSLIQYYSKRSAHLIENPTVEQIKQYLAAGTPVYVVADGKLLPNPHFQNGGPAYHALIIRGYTEDSFITNDPGTQFGENYMYKYNDLMKSIRDWNMGDVKNGRRVVLVE